MRKTLFILVVFVMAFGNAGFAQHKTNLKSTATENVLKHYGVREETSVVPEIAFWHSASGEDYRTVYTYDEYDYYLIEEYTKIDQVHMDTNVLEEIAKNLPEDLNSYSLCDFNGYFGHEQL